MEGRGKAGKREVVLRVVHWVGMGSALRFIWDEAWCRRGFHCSRCLGILLECCHGESAKTWWISRKTTSWNCECVLVMVVAAIYWVTTLEAGGLVALNYWSSSGLDQCWRRPPRTMSRHCLRAGEEDSHSHIHEGQGVGSTSIHGHSTAHTIPATHPSCRYQQLPEPQNQANQVPQHKIDQLQHTQKHDKKCKETGIEPLL